MFKNSLMTIWETKTETRNRHPQRGNLPSLAYQIPTNGRARRLNQIRSLPTARWVVSDAGGIDADVGEFD